MLPRWCDRLAGRDDRRPPAGSRDGRRRRGPNGARPRSIAAVTLAGARPGSPSSGTDDGDGRRRRGWPCCSWPSAASDVRRRRSGIDATTRSPSRRRSRSATRSSPSPPRRARTTSPTRSTRTALRARHLHRGRHRPAPFDGSCGEGRRAARRRRAVARLSNLGIYSDTADGQARARPRCRTPPAVGPRRLPPRCHPDDLVTAARSSAARCVRCSSGRARCTAPVQPLESFGTQAPTATDYTDACIDSAGLMLEEVSVQSGALAERIIATAVDIPSHRHRRHVRHHRHPTPLADGGTESTPSTPPRRPSRLLGAGRPPDGYTLKGRYQLRHLADTSSSPTPPPPRLSPARRPPRGELRRRVRERRQAIVIAQGPTPGSPDADDGRHQRHHRRARVHEAAANSRAARSWPIRRARRAGTSTCPARCRWPRCSRWPRRCTPEHTPKPVAGAGCSRCRSRRRSTRSAPGTCSRPSRRRCSVVR